MQWPSRPAPAGAPACPCRGARGELGVGAEGGLAVAVAEVTAACGGLTTPYSTLAWRRRPLARVPGLHDGGELIGPRHQTMPWVYTSTVFG